MLTEDRKKDLETLASWAICAGDKYYFNMTQELFDKCMTGHEDAEHYKAYQHQRNIGFEAFQAEMIAKLAAINLADELHYMVADYNYDDGMWFLEQVVLNPACDQITAKMIYWLSQPTYFYDNFGSLQNCPSDNINKNCANFLITMERRANNEGFPTGLKLDKTILFEQPPRLNYTTQPYCQIPEAFR